MKLHTLMLTALLSLAATAAFADNPAPAAGGNPPPKGGMCAQNAQECQQLASKFDQWCSANADKCVEAKAHIEKMRERCESHKDKCQEMRERMRDRHHGDEDKSKDKDNDDDDTSSPPAA